MPPAASHRSPSWTFLSNHAHVMIAIHHCPQALVRELAERVEITERAVLRILQELEADGYIERLREGRRTCYRIIHARPLRHPLEAHRSVGDLVLMVHPIPPTG